MNRMISFGYGYKDGKLIVVESEAEIVKSIFTDYINGKILKEIADELTIKGIDFFNGKCCWNKNMVFRIIENKKYIGEDGYPEIISFEQYEAANAIKGRKANRKTSLPRETETLKKYVFAVNAVGCYIEERSGKREKSGTVRTAVNVISISTIASSTRRLKKRAKKYPAIRRY